MLHPSLKLLKLHEYQNETNSMPFLPDTLIPNFNPDNMHYPFQFNYFYAKRHIKFNMVLLHDDSFRRLKWPAKIRLCLSETALIVFPLSH